MKRESSPIRPAARTRASETERKLVQAAFELLRQGGLEACTAPAVAKRAGVAVGTIYRRFADKDALVAATLLEVTSLSGGGAETQVAAIVDEAADLRSFLRRAAEAAVGAMRDNRVFILALREFVRTTQDETWRRRCAAESGRARSVILKRALERFGAEIRGGEDALRMALAAIYGAAEVTYLSRLSGVFEETPEPKPFVDALVEMQVRYLT